MDFQKAESTSPQSAHGTSDEWLFMKWSGSQGTVGRRGKYVGEKMCDY
jgi:hypothetical protein